MQEKLQFGFNTALMSLAVPRDIFDRTLEHGTYFRRIVEFPSRQRVVDAAPHATGMVLTFNTKRIGALQDRTIRIDRCRQIATAINEVTERTSIEQLDPQLSVEIGTRRMDSGRLGFNAQLLWPEADPETIQAEATLSMQRTANQLRYMPKSILNESVYARISRDDGILLETNPIGSCSLDTDGNEFSPELATARLYAHNLYSPEMQLICLSGLIAIVRA